MKQSGSVLNSDFVLSYPSAPGTSAHAVTLALESDLNKTPPPSPSEQPAGGNDDGATADHRCALCRRTQGKMVCCVCVKHFHVECLKATGDKKEWECAKCSTECRRKKRLRRSASAVSGGGGAGFGLFDMNASPTREVDDDDNAHKIEERYEQEVLNKTVKCGNGATLLSVEATISTIGFVDPWEVGICKICGKDENDHILLLCDRCDAEYHTYCLNPPLQRILKSSWYCPICIVFITSQSQNTSREEDFDFMLLGQSTEKKRSEREITRYGLEALADLADNMESMKYWEPGVKEMVQSIIILEDMIKTDHLKEWSSLSAVAKISTVQSCALQIYALDVVVLFEKPPQPPPPPLPPMDLMEMVAAKTTRQRKKLPKSQK